MEKEELNTRLAPVVVFAYNRPTHLERTLQSLAANHHASSTHLIIYCDGPKENPARQDLINISEVQRIADSQQWPASLKVIRAQKNLGLAGSIIKGVGETLRFHEHVIVLEDDHVTSPWFLSFMNDALEQYRHDEQVACISGYIYPVHRPLPHTFFLKGADCWGWATWSRAWKIFNPDAQELLGKIMESGNESDFNFYDTYPYMGMLADRAQGKNSSWAICWYASAYLSGKLVLYPGFSLVHNIGNDDSGVHSSASNAWDVQLTGERLVPERIALSENAEAKRIIADYFEYSIGNPGLASRIRQRFRKMLGRR